MTSGYEYDPALELYLSVDPGYTNPFAGLWIQPIEKNERVVVLNEYYQRYRTTPENGKAMLSQHEDTGYKTLSGAFGDPANPERLALLTEVFGVIFQAPRRPVEVGQDMVKRWLKVRPDGKPGILISHRCKNLIRELTKYLRHEPGKGEHHAVDALRYFFCGWDRY